MEAVLWDMDGTLVDSEKLWDISLAALYAELGGELLPEVRASMVGSSAENTIRTVYIDLGLDHDPRAMAESDRWLHTYTAELFDGGSFAPALRPNQPRNTRALMQSLIADAELRERLASDDAFGRAAE